MKCIVCKRKIAEREDDIIDITLYDDICVDKVSDSDVCGGGVVTKQTIFHKRCCPREVLQIIG